jgi:hypothetical protein
VGGPVESGELFNSVSRHPTSLSFCVNLFYVPFHPLLPTTFAASHIPSSLTSALISATSRVPAYIVLKVDAVRSSETSVTMDQTIQCYLQKTVILFMGTR